MADAPRARSWSPAPWTGRSAKPVYSSCSVVSSASSGRCGDRGRRLGSPHLSVRLSSEFSLTALFVGFGKSTRVTIAPHSPILPCCSGSTRLNWSCTSDCSPCRSGRAVPSSPVRGARQLRLPAVPGAQQAAGGGGPPCPSAAPRPKGDNFHATDPESQQRYWQKNLRITGILLAIWFVVTFVVGFFTHRPEFHLLRLAFQLLGGRAGRAGGLRADHRFLRPI